ncbi:MAG: cytochrome c-type biosis protein CcmB [Gammaproteobacteria bacterium]|nr:cytochrome c-type biosis protein CcmB [Gammaproteobacteria bacterium]
MQMFHNSTSTVLIAVLKRDLVIGLRHRSELFNPLVFFFIVVTMFVLALGPYETTLRQVAPAVIWVAALLASTLSLDMMFHSDLDDGSLEQFLLSPHPLIIIVVAKILAHWLLTAAPLIVAALFLGLMVYLPQTAIMPLLLTLLLGTPVLSLVGAVLAALTVGLRGSGILLTLLILPLYIPVLIFSVATVDNAAKGLAITGELYFLGAILVLAATLAPLATTSSLRIRLG